MEDRPIPRDIAWREGRWFTFGRLWGITHYVLGVIAVVTPILASSVTKGTAFQISSTALAALCAALITFLQPSRKSDSYWRGWRHLDAAIRRYRSGTLSREDLNKAIDEGETIIQSSALASVDKHAQSV
jgi:hypothetical protein